MHLSLFFSFLHVSELFWSSSFSFFLSDYSQYTARHRCDLLVIDDFWVSPGSLDDRTDTGPERPGNGENRHSLADRRVSCLALYTLVERFSIMESGDTVEDLVDGDAPTATPSDDIVNGVDINGENNGSEDTRLYTVEDYVRTAGCAACAEVWTQASASIKPHDFYRYLPFPWAAILQTIVQKCCNVLWRKWAELSRLIWGRYQYQRLSSVTSIRILIIRACSWTGETYSLSP